ncbi:MAG TPA: DNA-binding protein [Lachnospiraceae bacterium]|jgi:predicted DNA-binding protein YlxM (UPF0122 family)|nr:DNA-binding protein [Lachnospiraceae bacterium]MDD6148678.1 DNA-binding protein [Lachnospiraceae bacterium]MDY5705005.1 DNA-binding protein [Lachnospiraceae bacterium]MEE3356465.1 DNA-binding protein [Lachnospiraceae bacterium]HAN50884.1 DNA-binding protein [Lachnospiraceae bacterium]
MDDKIRQGDLYDFYGMLLNEHQRSIYEDYVLNDLSLGEIAENEGISRQGVHDLVKRCTQQMESFESKMHLIMKFQLVRENVNRINQLLDSSDELPRDRRLDLQKLTREILEEI